MYTIHADGMLFFSTAEEGGEYAVINPKLTLDVNGTDSLSFDLPPGNVMHGQIKRLKSIVTVEQDGEIIFRGRVMDEEKDFYNQITVYCEGERSFLLDSLKKPYSYSGSIQEFFADLIDNHNAQVDEEKQFAVGNITAVGADETMEAEETAYTDTASVIENRLLGAYGGYIRTRHEADAVYIDWLAAPGDDAAQAIEFSVNLLDIKNKTDAAEVFTCLIPLGKSEIEDGEYGEPVGIASVNDGLYYIQDDEAVALYGKIWRTQTWPYEEDPAQLLEKAQEYLKTGVAVQTLTLTAVDMHFADGNVDMIRIGSGVHIRSEPHGLDMTMHCVKMEVDLFKPEDTSYTFGEPPRALTENIVQDEESVRSLTGGGGRGGGRSIRQEAQDILRWAKIIVDEDRAKIALMAGVQYEEIDGSYTLKQAGIDINGEEGSVGLLARVNDAETTLYLNSDGLLSKVSENGLISSINQSAEAVTINAEKINLEGYVTASQLDTEFAEFENGISDSLFVSALSATDFECNDFDFKGYGVSLSTATFLTSSTTLTVNATGGTVTGVTLNKRTNTIYYLDWE